MSAPTSPYRGRSGSESDSPLMGKESILSLSAPVSPADSPRRDSSLRLAWASSDTISASDSFSSSTSSKHGSKHSSPSPARKRKSRVKRAGRKNGSLVRRVGKRTGTRKSRLVSSAGVSRHPPTQANGHKSTNGVAASNHSAASRLANGDARTHKHSRSRVRRSKRLSSSADFGSSKVKASLHSERFGSGSYKSSSKTASGLAGYLQDFHEKSQNGGTDSDPQARHARIRSYVGYLRSSSMPRLSSLTKRLASLRLKRRQIQQQKKQMTKSLSAAALSHVRSGSTSTSSSTGGGPVRKTKPVHGRSSSMQLGKRRGVRRAQSLQVGSLRTSIVNAVKKVKKKRSGSAGKTSKRTPPKTKKKGKSPVRRIGGVSLQSALARAKTKAKGRGKGGKRGKRKTAGRKASSVNGDRGMAKANGNGHVAPVVPRVVKQRSLPTDPILQQPRMTDWNQGLGEHPFFRSTSMPVSVIHEASQSFMTSSSESPSEEEVEDVQRAVAAHLNGLADQSDDSDSDSSQELLFREPLRARSYEEEDDSGTAPTTESKANAAARLKVDVAVSAATVLRMSRVSSDSVAALTNHRAAWSTDDDETPAPPSASQSVDTPVELHPKPRKVVPSSAPAAPYSPHSPTAIIKPRLRRRKVKRKTSASVMKRSAARNAAVRSKSRPVVTRRKKALRGPRASLLDDEHHDCFEPAPPPPGKLPGHMVHGIPKIPLHLVPVRLAQQRRRAEALKKKMNRGHQKGKIKRASKVNSKSKSTTAGVVKRKKRKGKGKKGVKHFSSVLPK